MNGNSSKNMAGVFLEELTLARAQVGALCNKPGFAPLGMLADLRCATRRDLRRLGCAVEESDMYYISANAPRCATLRVLRRFDDGLSMYDNAGFAPRCATNCDLRRSTG